MNQLQILDDILYKGLQPWLPENNPDEKFAPMLSEIKAFEPKIKMKYEVDFFRPFNNKTKYYQKLIFREMTKYCDLVISLIADDSNHQVKKYWLNDTLEKKLKTRLKEIGKLLKERHLDISYIDPSKSTFDMDANHKTDTYIIQLLKTCLIKIYLEIQDAYLNFREDVMVIEDFYTQLLFEPIPTNSFLKEALPILTIEPVKTIAIEIPIPADVKSHNSFTYKKLSKNAESLNDLYDCLKKNKLIADDTTTINFKKIFSGKEIAQPVIWTGNPSELYYFIHLIYTEYKLVDDLKQKQWKVACLCFIQPNGIKFESSKLRPLKKPQLSAYKIEKAIDLIK
jgi:hypothetical protein